MDPMNCVRDYLLDNIGHLTYPGQPSFDQSSKRWSVPICCRTVEGDIVVGDVELDQEGHILFAPGKEELLERLEAGVF